MASVADPAPDPNHTGRPIEVEVIYAEPQRHQLVHLCLPTGSTLRQAIEASGIIATFPEMDPAKYEFGIFGRIARADTLLRVGDRIEIYRPLLADPKEIRKHRADAGVQARKKAKR